MTDSKASTSSDASGPLAATPEHASGARVWLFAFGYIACYVPYSALTKALSAGRMGPRISGLALLPWTTMTSAVAMFATITLLGWWKYAGRTSLLGISMPRPTRWTFLSGIATATIVMTTTLAYTFQGVSIPLVMLLMRGGVLMLAPVVDVLNKRRVRWFSWGALGLSVIALLDAAYGIHTATFPWLGVLDIALYLAAYFVRLRFMSHLAKTHDADVMRRYFVEEQMVATPIAVLLLAVVSLGGAHSALSRELAFGFVEVVRHPAFLLVVLTGVLSQGTGVFGGLVLLDASENTFSVPLNRASSVLAGLLASVSLAVLYADPFPTANELISASALVVAMIVLWVGPRLRVRTG